METLPNSGWLLMRGERDPAIMAVVAIAKIMPRNKTKKSPCGDF